MHKDIHKTVVIFRVYKDSGDVIALFPELLSRAMDEKRWAAVRR